MKINNNNETNLIDNTLPSLKVINTISTLNSNYDNAEFEILLNNIVNANNNAKEKTEELVAQYEGQNLEKLPLLTNGQSYINSSYNKNSVGDISNTSNVYKNVTAEIKDAVEKASNKYGVDKELIMAIIEHESGFQSNVTSSAGAQGLMQILPSNFSSLNITDGYDIEQNINGGTHLLKECIDLYNGDEKMGLIAYAGGCGIMEKRGVESFLDLYKMPSEARKAVPEIIEIYKKNKENK